MSTSSLDTAIQSLPLELREKICKELISAKLKERSEMGWDAVHEEVEKIDTERKCLECGIRRLVRTLLICSECVRCANCGNFLERDCPLCKVRISEEPQLCWLCCEPDEEECDMCPIHEWCNFCGSCDCPSRQIRPL